MQIVCAYIDGLLREETEAVLASQPDVRFHPLPAHDPFAYGRLLADYWRGAADDLLIVEQDILPTAADISLMAVCPNLYCGAPYEWTTDVGVALGFTRFRREFMLQYPTAMEQTIARGLGWKQLDVTFQRAILVRQYGEQPHVHPQVRHLNAEKKLMEGADPNPLQTLPAW